MIQRIEIEVPALSEERQAIDLETALTGVTGIQRVDVDVERHVVSIDYDTEMIDRPYLEGIITDIGYPVGRQETDGS